MSDSADQHPTERFSNRVEHYAKYRPRYPRELLTLLSREVGLHPGAVLADVGSGTGILSELLLRNGNIVYGVEPNGPMRLAAERALVGWGGFHSVNATAERTGLADASVDGVLCAQAFHWFEPREAAGEFRRIARPSGWVALIWNCRQTHASSFMIEYERIVHAYGSELARSGREIVAEPVLQELFGRRLRRAGLANFQELDWEGVRGRLLSASYVPAEGQDGWEPMIADLRRAYAAHEKGGVVRMEYETRVYYGELRGG